MLKRKAGAEEFLHILFTICRSPEECFYGRRTQLIGVHERCAGAWACNFVRECEAGRNLSIKAY
jgi:hypothetical protein